MCLTFAASVEWSISCAAWWGKAQVFNPPFHWWIQILQFLCRRFLSLDFFPGECKVNQPRLHDETEIVLNYGSNFFRIRTMVIWKISGWKLLKIAHTRSSFPKCRTQVCQILGQSLDSEPYVEVEFDTESCHFSKMPTIQFIFGMKWARVN